MNCNMSFSLGIVSIILIISIVLLVLYRNMKDNKYKGIITSIYNNGAR